MLGIGMFPSIHPLENKDYLTLCNENDRNVVKGREPDGLVDVWRDNLLTKGYTIFQVGYEKRVRLDYFLVYPNLREY